MGQGADPQAEPGSLGCIAPWSFCPPCFNSRGALERVQEILLKCYPSILVPPNAFDVSADVLPSSFRWRMRRIGCLNGLDIEYSAKKRKSRPRCRVSCGCTPVIQLLFAVDCPVTVQSLLGNCSATVRLRFGYSLVNSLFLSVSSPPSLIGVCVLCPLRWRSRQESSTGYDHNF